MTASPIEPPLAAAATVPASSRSLAIRATVVGLLLATLSIAGDIPGTPRVVTLIGNIAAPWAFGAFVAGLGTPRPRAGALAGAASLTVATVAYYALYAPWGRVPGAGEAVWLAMALAIGPVAGWCGATLRDGSEGRSRAAAATLAPALLLAEAAWLVVDRRVWLWAPILSVRAADLTVLLTVAFTGLAIAWRFAPPTRRGRYATGVVLTTGVGAVALEALHRGLVLV